MYDNSSLSDRCRSLWAEVLCAVESRVWAVNDYLKDPRSRLDSHMMNSESVLIEQPSVNRLLVATLDLEEHAIRVQEFERDAPTLASRLPLALLGDGNVYVTDGKSLFGNATAVARQLLSILLSNAVEVSNAQNDLYRSWAAALMTARAQRQNIRLPIEIQTETSVFPASTIDLSNVGAKVHSSEKLDCGSYVTIFRGTLGSFFRVVWSEDAELGSRAGLVCLNPPLEWVAETTVQ